MTPSVTAQPRRRLSGEPKAPSPDSVKPFHPPVTLVATVGPALLNPAVLQRIAQFGRVLFRLNGAHGTPEAVSAWVDTLEKHIPQVSILLDLPGRKIRLTGLGQPLAFRAGERVRVAQTQFSIPGITASMKPGQLMLANDGTTRLVVESIGNPVTLCAETDGVIFNGKGVHIRGAIAGVPLLLERDLALLNAVAGRRVSHVGLSFVCSAEDVVSGLKVINKFLPGTQVIPKVETEGAVQNLNEILSLVDAVILDRGDLAGEIGLEYLPEAQEMILSSCRRNHVRVIVATQLLKSMQEQRIPVIAELTEIYRLLEMGVFGLQLSEETAVGKFPEECVQIILAMSRRVAAKR